MIGVKGLYVSAFARPPEERMGDVVALVRIQRDGHCVQTAGDAPYERSQPLHVAVRTGHRQRWGQRSAAGGIDGAPVRGQVAEIVLGIDGQQMQGDGGTGHGGVRGKGR